MFDFNRSGVPLIEMVTHPDLRGPEEAFAYLSALKAVLLYRRGLRLQHGGGLAPL